MGKKELRLGLLQYEVAKPDTPGEASPAPTNHALTLCTWRSRLATWLYVGAQMVHEYLLHAVDC
jgi:hypothetical protein